MFPQRHAKIHGQGAFVGIAKVRAQAVGRPLWAPRRALIFEAYWVLEVCYPAHSKEADGLSSHQYQQQASVSS